MVKRGDAFKCAIIASHPARLIPLEVVEAKKTGAWHWRISWLVAILACTLLVLSLVLASPRFADGSNVLMTRFSSILVPPDTDGDGVHDSLDRGSYSPAQLSFRSSWGTAWDGDGCMDSEDYDDDDGATILKVRVTCPRTRLKASVDLKGRSHAQIERLQPWSFPDYTKFADILLEVIVGAILTATYNCVCDVVQRRRRRSLISASARHIP